MPRAVPTTGLTRGADATLAEQLAGRYAETIRQRLLAPGARLPSVRECARRHGVSAATVVAAYDRLLAVGAVEARPQRGFFVRAPNTRSTASAKAVPTPLRPAFDSATALVRGMFQTDGRPMPGLGTLPANWLDAPLLARATKRAAADSASGDTALRYGDPLGERRLRTALSHRLEGLGIACPPERIVTTVGATHALDVVTRSFCRAGDTILVDEPGWPVEFARLSALGLRVLPVPRGAAGPDLAAMRRLVLAQPRGERPRLYITVSVLHNPTGASLDAPSAHALLALARELDLTVVEDDTYAHLAPKQTVRLSAIDGLARTVYVSGFSKILTPNWRVGFLAAPAALVDRFVDAKLLSTLTTPALAELALSHCLEEGWLRRHAERVVRRLSAARTRTVRLAEAHGCRFAAEPKGLFGWIDAGVDTERLAHAMLDRWLLAPGALFHADRRPSTLMRINYATSQDARFWADLAAERDRLR